MLRLRASLLQPMKWSRLARCRGAELQKSMERRSIHRPALRRSSAYSRWSSLQAALLIPADRIASGRTITS